MAAAAERFLESVLPAGSPKVADKDAWRVSYVKLRLKEKELARLASTASSLAVVSSNSAVTLAAASSCSQVEQVRAELNKLKLQHDISPLSVWSGPWREGSDLFNRALERLREQEVCRCQAEIEGLVLDVQKLHSDRAAAGCANKETKQIQSRARRKRQKVRMLLDEMYVWQGLGACKAVSRLSEDEVKGLYVAGRRPPWSSSESDIQALNVHYGRLYHAACANVARATEEEGFLRASKVRLSRWIQHTLKCLNVARVAHLGKCAGRVFLIDRRLAVIKALQKELSQCQLPDPLGH
ncbi:hypothetical protein Vafri_15552 [Volvox africanus]|uniref:Uncharacterized protein n=1 Tax=Volvox africanus TaxID=51714 RepID=A0A8J4BFQ3_9CHLO|nr:hypothetical protein Vafri_15552 [Volvox africanus]